MRLRIGRVTRPDKRETLLSFDMLVALASALSFGKLIVPLRSALGSAEGIEFDFLTVSVDHPEHGRGPITAVPLFLSPNALAASGLPADIGVVQPTVVDLHALLGDDQWVALDPSTEGVLLACLSDLAKWWAEIVAMAARSANEFT